MQLPCFGQESRLAKEEHDAQVQTQAAEDADKRHREDDANTEDVSKKGQCKCKGKETTSW